MGAVILSPFTVDETSLTATNLTETAVGWSPLASYDAGDEVYLTATKKVYVSAIDGNVNNDPATSDATTWIVKGAMNKWAAFDYYVSNKATRAGSITYSITLDDVVDAIAFVGLRADDLTVTVTKGENTATYEADLRDFSYIDGSLWNWLTGGRPTLNAFSLQNMAYFGIGTVLDITIEVDAGNAEVGQIVMGRPNDIGDLLAGVELRNQSFSRYSEDEFGNVVIVKRSVVAIYDAELSQISGNVLRTQSILKELMDVPTVFIGSETTELGLIVFGVLLSAQPTIPHHKMHRIKISFRELL